MLERARQLIQPSARGNVPPFMVMDVVAAAARLETQGRRIIHMEVGQPAVGAPPSAIAAAVEGSLMLGKGEIPVIVFGVLFAMLFIFEAASPLQTGVYSEHRNYTDALQRAEDNK